MVPALALEDISCTFISRDDRSQRYTAVKDTTLVAIIGLFDLVGILQAGLRDAAWASYVSAPTGYLAVALIYWVFCFGMSRYSMYTERRLQTGHKR